MLLVAARGCHGVYGVVSNFFRDKRRYQYQLAVVVIAKNESEYIEEWIAFQKVIGVDCVFLYDNDSTDNMKDRIQRYIDEGFVIYNTITGTCMQLDAYNDALKRYGGLCRYLAFVDCDEFLLPSNPAEHVPELIDHAFKKDRSAGGLCINWAMYGSSGHKTKTPGLVMERFVYRSQTDFEGKDHIKSVVRPACVHSYIHPHYPQYRTGYYGVNFSGDIVPTWKNSIKEYPSCRLNHYFTKSEEEWDVRRSAGRADVKVDDAQFRRSKDQFWKYDKNDVKDELALHFVEKVKAIINSK